MSSFELEIPRKAQVLDYNSLPSNQKDALSNGINIDCEVHKAFRIGVIIHTHHQITGSKKKIKRWDFSKADSVTVTISTSSNPEINIINVFPQSLTIDGNVTEIGGNIEVNSWILKIGGFFKKNFFKKKLLVFKQHNLSKAKWLFNKDYFNNGNQIQVDFLCNIPHNLESERRFVQFEILVFDGKRLLDSKRKKIALF